MEQTARADHEVSHGRYLASGNPEELWGWGTPAGRRRADRRARMILEFARIRAGMKVLEIGCGNGNFTEKFATSGADIVAVDISPELIEMARQRRRSTCKVQFRLGRFEDMGDSETPYDAIIGSSVLHHLDLPVALSCIRRLLKPGGWMSFAEPNMLNPQIFMERHCRWLFPQVSPDETAFIRSKLRMDIESIGFVNVCIRPFDWLHPMTPRLLIRAVDAFGGWLERIPGIREHSGSLCICARNPPSSDGHAAGGDRV